jgi:hypothetical protein
LHDRIPGSDQLRNEVPFEPHKRGDCDCVTVRREVIATTPMEVCHQAGFVVPRGRLARVAGPMDTAWNAGTVEKLDGAGVVAFAEAVLISAASFEALATAGCTLELDDGENTTSTQKFMPAPLTSGKLPS